MYQISLDTQCYTWGYDATVTFWLTENEHLVCP